MLSASVWLLKKLSNFLSTSVFGKNAFRFSMLREAWCRGRRGAGLLTPVTNGRAHGSVCVREDARDVTLPEQSDPRTTPAAFHVPWFKVSGPQRQ